MPASITRDIYERLPTPVARLLHLASLTKDQKKRHDYAFAAWDVTFRLVVAAAPPEDMTALREPSIGAWKQALRLRETSSRSSELLEFHEFLRRQLQLQQRPLRSIKPQQLVEHLPAYRNKFTTAHASPREDAFYAEAAQHLVLALSRAWEEGFFWDSEDKLLFVPDIEVDEDGLHRARLFEMTGPEAHALEEGTVVPQEVRRGRVYLRQQGAYRSLHPWIVFRMQEIKQQLLLFNSSNRGYQFLDCESGEIWNVSQLGRYGISESDLSLLPPAVMPREEPAPESSVAAHTPLPDVEQHAKAHQGPSRRKEEQDSCSAPSSATSPAWPPAGWPSLRSAPYKVSVVAGLMLVGLGLWQLPGHWGIPAISDWFFEDKQGGRGWLERCRAHLDQQRITVSEVACRRGLGVSSDGDTRAELWSQLARGARMRNDPLQARVFQVEAYQSHPGAASEQMLEQACSEERLPSKEPGVQESVKLVSTTGALLRKDPQPQTPGIPVARGTCLAVGPASVRPTEGGMGVWFEAARYSGATLERGWIREEELLPPLDGATWLSRCHTYFLGGMVDQALFACQRSFESTAAPSVRSRAHEIMAVAMLQRNQSTNALEHLIDAHELAVDEEAKNRVAKQIEDTCAEGNSPPRAPGDTRAYKVVSWRRGADKLANVRNEPSTTSSTSRIIGALLRPTCVLVEPVQKITLKSGASELWFPVEVLLQGTSTKGWMHRILLAP